MQIDIDMSVPQAQYSPTEQLLHSKNLSAIICIVSEILSAAGSCT